MKPLAEPLRSRQVLTGRSLYLFLAILLACSGITVFLSSAIAQVSDLFPGALPDQWYPVTANVLLVYAIVPAVLVAAIVLLLAPGFALALAFCRPRDTVDVVLMTYLVSAVLHLLTFSAIKFIVTEPPGVTFRNIIIATNLLAWLALYLRVRAGKAVFPFRTPKDIRRSVLLAGTLLVTLYLLYPFIFWQDFNPDGLEILTMGRSLALHILPRLPTGEVPGLGVGMITAAYPVHWFVALFGPVEPAARLPLLLYCPLLLAGMYGLIELGSARSLRLSEDIVVVIGLSVVIAAMVFNDAYHAYAVDIASPANIDLLAMSLMVAAAYFLWAGRPGWFLLFALFCYFTRPTGLLFLLLLGIGIIISDTPGKRSLLRITGVAIAGCLLLGYSYNQAFEPSAMGNIADRLRFLRFDDYGRLLFLLVPAGILPPVALFLRRSHDFISRSLTVITLGYFAFFYLVAFVVLHHFLPAMVLPVIVFWRVALRGSWQPVLTGTAAAAAVVALVAVQPRCYLVDRTIRNIGQATDYSIGNYHGRYAEYREAFDQKNLLDSLFPPWYQVEDPATELIGSAWLLVHYATQSSAPGTNYVVRRSGEPAPPGFTRIADNGTGAVYVKDMGRWQQDRHSPPRTDCRSPILEIPKETIYRRFGEPAGSYSVDMQQVVKRIRRFVMRAIGMENRSGPSGGES